MGYGGKVREQQRARELHAEAWTLQDIATELGVSKSSVSLWVRDVEFTPRPRNRGHRSMKPHPMHIRKLAEIEQCRSDGLERIGRISDREFLILGLALYAGEGGQDDGRSPVRQQRPTLILTFVTWLRHFFDIDEARLRMRLYLHADLDLDAAVQFWSSLTAIPVDQFGKPCRAVPDATIRCNRHVFGCPGVSYCCTNTHRRVMGMIEAILSPSSLPG